MAERTSAHYLALVRGAAQDAAELEQIYRQAVATGEERAFREAVATVLQSGQRTPVLLAWGYRLDLLPLPASGEMAPGRSAGGPSDPSRSWGPALAVSLGLGLLWTLLAGDQPPVPFPDAARPLFWLGWAPATGFAILAYLALAGNPGVRERRWLLAAGTLVALAALAGGLARARTDDVAFLTAAHLPLAVVLALGVAVTGPADRPGAQWFPLLLKYAEVLLTAGVFAMASGFLGALTMGIFAVLGIQIPDATVERAAAFVLGTLPVLAVASVYNPRAVPTGQDLTQGPLRLLRLFARLALPAVAGVLVLYLFWFLPHHFWRGFQDRSLLLVYNLTVVTLLGLMALAVPTRDEAGTSPWLRRVLILTAFLTFLLNAYALAANLSRVWHFGLTPNRHAVAGWNGVTLALLAAILLGQVRATDRDWTERFAAALVRFLPLLAGWVGWVLVASPFLW
ncbi:MAG: hypothetical protein DIU70_006720 [Bacillota bacterium]